MNRRDNFTKHHTSVAGSLEAIDTYISLGLAPSKAILGFAFYAKWFTTDPKSDCATNPLGCATVPMEDASGNDNGLSGAMTFETANMEPTVIPSNLTVDPNGSCGAAAGYKCGEGNCCSQYGFWYGPHIMKCRRHVLTLPVAILRITAVPHVSRATVPAQEYPLLILGVALATIAYQTPRTAANTTGTPQQTSSGPGTPQHSLLRSFRKL